MSLVAQGVAGASLRYLPLFWAPVLVYVHFEGVPILFLQIQVGLGSLRDLIVVFQSSLLFCLILLHLVVLESDDKGL